MERLNYGINASRKATYDQTLEKAWREYTRGSLSYGGLYSASNDYLNKEYRQNQCFSTTILWCYEEPERMNCSVYNNAAGGTYQQVQTYWREDHERVKAFLSTWTRHWGTSIWTAGSTWSETSLTIRIISSER